MMVLELPTPPSANNLYANGERGRYVTPKYRAWRAAADASLLRQKPVWRNREPIHKAKLTIKIPASTRGDVDNRSKAICDLLVKTGITTDDRNNQKVSIEKDPNAHCCIVLIEAGV